MLKFGRLVHFQLTEAVVIMLTVNRSPARYLGVVHSMSAGYYMMAHVFVSVNRPGKSSLARLPSRLVRYVTLSYCGSSTREITRLETSRRFIFLWV
jgi:hypothetical protein